MQTVFFKKFSCIGFSCLLLLSLLVGTCYAQGPPKKFLLLKRGGNQKTQLRYYMGETLTYKSKKIGYFVSDKLVDLDTEYLYLNENIVKVEDILAIDIRHKDPRNRTLNNLSTLFLGAGIMAISLESVNSLYQQGQVQVSSGLAKTSAILVGTGLALLPLRYKLFTLSEKNKVQLVSQEID